MDNIAGRKSSLSIATHLAVLALVLIWLIPTVGLLVSSFRDRDQISASGWWQAPFSVELTFRTAAGGDAAQIDADYVLTGNIFDDPALQQTFGSGAGRVTAFSVSAFDPRSAVAGTEIETRGGARLTVNPDGTYRLVSAEAPSGTQRIYFAAKTPPQFTLANYRQVLTADNMDRAFINTMTVTIPATIIPILIAAVVGLLVVPLQLALVPMLNFHNSIGIGQSFLGIWFAHTAFGMPLAVYLLRNYMVGLPRDIIESAKVDGATDFQVFTRIVLPLSLPALAAFSIFQFLWTWNDLLVAKVFLPSNDASKVMTVKIADDLLGSRGGDWGILATAAFVSIAVPLVVFFTMQRFLVRGLLAGSVK